MGADTPTRTLFRGPYRRTAWSVCALVSLYAFEEMGVAAALPTAVADVGGLSYFGWVFTGFLATSVVGMATSAYLCDRFGPRVPIVACVTIFVVGLVVAGTATAMAPLVAGRVIQGLSGGGLMTATYVVVGTHVPAELRTRMFAAIAFCWVIPGVVGPTVSGAVTEHVSWRWIFLGLAPVAVAAAAMLVPALSHQPSGPVGTAAPAGAPPRPSRILYAVAAAVGVSTVQVGAGRPSPLSAAAIVGGVALLGFALRALLPPGTARLRSPVGVPIALRGITAGALFGVESVIPLMLVTQHGLGPLEASIPLACAGLPCALAAWWASRPGAGDRLDRQVRLARRGFVLLGIADASFIWLSQPASTEWLMGPAWVLAGFGIGLVVPTMNALALERTADTDRSANASSLQIADTTASCVTTGFAGVLVTYATRGSLGFTTAFVVIGASMTAIALVGAAAAGRLRPA